MEILNEVGLVVSPSQELWMTAGADMVRAVTRPEGIGSTGTWERSPEAVTAESGTQHCVLPKVGISIFHQVCTRIVPRIWAFLPSRSVVIEEKEVPGPKRQAASSVLGVTAGPVMGAGGWQAVKTMHKQAAAPTKLRINPLGRFGLCILQRPQDQTVKAKQYPQRNPGNGNPFQPGEQS